MISVLIVDDHEIVRRGLKEIFDDEFSELEMGEAENSRAALELITKRTGTSFCWTSACPVATALKY